MELNGKYGKALIFNDEVDSSSISQIKTLLDQPMADGANIRIMPDVHAGAGCVIGFTAKKTDKIVPNLIGVDIACGVTAWNLGKISPKFDELDSFIRKYIPSGKNIRSEELSLGTIDGAFRSINREASLTEFDNNVYRLCGKTGQNFDYVYNSLGTLGGGNHFIELDEDDSGSIWLIIHSGSRNFGLKVAKYHQNIAKKNAKKTYTDDDVKSIINKYKDNKNRGLLIKAEIDELKKSKSKVDSGLEYLEGREAEDYFADMKVAQMYAALNRRIMAHIIINEVYDKRYSGVDMVESVHNYIDFDSGIIRKGAISANLGEKVIIPLNMADGVIIGVGKGNDEWNCSAPHGAGRKMSRSKAKESIELADFQKVMKGVWSTSISNSTIDEAPMAYKKATDIIKYLGPTVEIICHMKPIYNFKAG